MWAKIYRGGGRTTATRLHPAPYAYASMWLVAYEVWSCHFMYLRNCIVSSKLYLRHMILQTFCAEIMRSLTIYALYRRAKD